MGSTADHETPEEHSTVPLLVCARVIDLAETFAEVLAQLSPFLLLGFAAAGLLHAMVPTRWLGWALGGSGAGPITRAALIGIPLPLCSCGVIPVAVELRKQGAGRGATTSFLISTPETGVDSVSVSIAVLHPLMVVFRPLAALFTAIISGFAVERLTSGPDEVDDGGSCAHHDTGEEFRAGPKGFLGGMRYAFVDLFADVGLYLMPAVLVTAVIMSFIDPQTVPELVPGRFLQMLLLLVAGVPLYVCAAAATPVAAALILAGFSPGAVLVFLLAGPATNLITISAAVKTLGRSGAAVYCASIAVVSLAFGALLDLLYDQLQIESTASAGGSHDHLGWVHWTSAGIMAALVLWHTVRRLRKGRA